MAGYRAGYKLGKKTDVSRMAMRIARAGYRRARRVKARKQAISISMLFYRLYRSGKWV